MIINQLLFLFFYFVFSAFLLLVAFLGLFLKSNPETIPDNFVLNSTTICKILFQKKLLDQSEYDFETKQVAPIYNQHIFEGYLLIVAPIVFMLKHSQYIDKISLRLVRRWIVIHKDKLGGIKNASWIEHWLVDVCIEIASSVGKVLITLKGFKKKIKSK